MAAATAASTTDRDFVPQTTEGKVLTSAVITLTVLVFIPTITANLASKLIVNRDAFTHEEQEEIKNKLTASLARLDEPADREG